MTQQADRSFDNEIMFPRGRPRRRTHGGPARACPLHPDGMPHAGVYCIAIRCQHASTDAGECTMTCELEEVSEPDGSRSDARGRQALEV